MRLAARAASFEDTWQNARGLGRLSNVAHKPIGLRFIATSLVFFAAGGILALLMRIQLARPNNRFLDPQTYNELFTMHGSTMMFLFAVPFMEAIAAYLLPMQLGARDLPFPRLNAFNYWIFLFGGLIFYSSFVVGAVPDGGWFAYPPLTEKAFSPGLGMDFWLLGLTMLEIAGIGAAIELIAAVMKLRAPGMSVSRIPVFVWAIFVVAVMIVFAFTALLLATVLLESDRTFGTAFFRADAGGDPLLWQHLFWFFGHPEVYIMFLPATGIVSAVVPVFARTRLAGYPLVVAAVAATGLLSFGLWIHHMFATGVPLLTAAFFGGTSFLIAMASGVQVFAWIATIWKGRVWPKTALMYVLGFLFIFVIGGITGVMIAAVPFDWQVHDSFFIVAHFHYVLIGGVVFPAFAGLHFWLPKISGKRMSEGLGRLSFWLAFVGFNVTFLPMHWLGLFGMPRRVYTYQEGLGLGGLNLLSTIGAFILAAGFVTVLVNFLWSIRRTGAPAGANPWDADMLEWSIPSPPPTYNFDRIPIVRDRHALWEPPHDEEPAERDAVEALERRPETWRASLGTTIVDARPEQVVQHPSNTYSPLAAASGIALSVVGVLADTVPLIVAGAVVGLLGAAYWLRASQHDDAQRHRDPVDLPAVVPHARDMPWWGAAWYAVALVAIVAHLVFSTFYLRATTDTWPPPGIEPRPLLLPIVATLVLLLGLVAVPFAIRCLREERIGSARLWLAAAIVTGGIVLAFEVWELIAVDLPPSANAYMSLLYMFLGVHGAALVAGLVLLAYALMRSWSSDSRARVFSVGRAAATAWYGAIASWILTFATVYVAPRVS